MLCNVFGLFSANFWSGQQSIGRARNLEQQEAGKFPQGGKLVVLKSENKKLECTQMPPSAHSLRVLRETRRLTFAATLVHTYNTLQSLGRVYSHLMSVTPL